MYFLPYPNPFFSILFLLSFLSPMLQQRQFPSSQFYSKYLKMSFLLPSIPWSMHSRTRTWDMAYISSLSWTAKAANLERMLTFVISPCIYPLYPPRIVDGRRTKKHWHFLVDLTNVLQLMIHPKKAVKLIFGMFFKKFLCYTKWWFSQKSKGKRSRINILFSYLVALAKTSRQCG